MSILSIRSCLSQESTIKSYSQKNSIIYKSALALFPLVSHRRSRLSASERTQPSITRFARLIPLPRAARCKSPLGCLLIAHEVWRLKPFPLRSKVIRLQQFMPLSSPQGKNDRIRYRRPEWTLILRGPRDSSFAGI